MGHAPPGKAASDRRRTGRDLIRQSPRDRLRNILRLLLPVLGLAVLMLGSFLAFLQISGNFHAVSPGKVYRAAQMDGQALARWKREYGIASVLNLRGPDAGADWYETERAVSDRLGIRHMDFRMSAGSELTQDEVRRLLALMRDAPKPLLIHCKSGADRTGLAAALYVAAVDHRSELAAEWQLSLAFGHIGLPLSQAWPMNLTWERIEPWLGYSDS